MAILALQYHSDQMVFTFVEVVNLSGSDEYLAKWSDSNNLISFSGHSLH